MLRPAMAYTVAQNTSFLTASSILQKIVSFGYFAIIAHLIGVGNTGNYFFAIAFTSIFTVVADFGMGPILTREASKFPDQADKYFNTVFWSKVVFGIGAYLLVLIFANLLDYSAELKSLIYLSGVTMFFDNLQGCFFSIFRAKKNLMYESFAIVLAQILTLVIGTAALVMKANLIWLIAAYAIPSCLNVFLFSFLLKRDFKMNFSLTFDKLVFKQFLFLAVPFAVAGILGRLYSYSDSLLMSKMLNSQYLGWWSIPYKITFAFQFIPMALSASVYPAMSSYSISEPNRVAGLFMKAWKYLFIIVFPLSLGLMAVAHPVVIHFFGANYEPSIPVLRILLISLIFSYLSIISGALLNAMNKQKIQTSIIGVSVVLNIVLNLILIPKYTIVGAAYSALFSNIVLWSLGYYFVKRSVPIETSSLFRAGVRVLIPATFMSICVYLLTFKLSYFITIPVGALLYGSLLFVTGFLKVEQIRELFEKIRIKKIV